MDSPKPETEASPTITKPVVGDSKLMHQKFVDIMSNQTSDVHIVQFIFERENGVTKIPANKAVLAASSAVFDAMLFGDLREDGDVPIVDATPEAFKEFLQLFYGQVELTMHNIADVLKLVDKYGVVNCSTNCVEFLKQNLTTDDILWGLHLAVKYHFDDLREHCKLEIQRNYFKVFDMINFDKDNNIKLCTSSNIRLSQTELENILLNVFPIAKNVISTLSRSNIFPITLSSEQLDSDSWVKNNESIMFSLDASLFLTEIFCSKIGTSDETPSNASRRFDIYIGEKSNLKDWDYKKLYAARIEIGPGKYRIKLPSPIAIKPNYVYGIIFEMMPYSQVLTFKSTIPDSAVELAPGVKISFQPTSSQQEHSLISKLYFTHSTEN